MDDYKIIYAFSNLKEGEEVMVQLNKKTTAVVRKLDEKDTYDVYLYDKNCYGISFPRKYQRIAYGLIDLCRIISNEGYGEE